MVKGIAAGWAAACMYKAVSSKSDTGAVVSAAIISPIANTGIFIIGVLAFFQPTLLDWGRCGRYGHSELYPLRSRGRQLCDRNGAQHSALERHRAHHQLPREGAGRNMLLVIDAGNTSISAGCLEDGKLLCKVQFSSERRSADELAVLISSALRMRGMDTALFEGASIACVVPPLLEVLKEAAYLVTGCVPLVVGAGVKTGLNIGIGRPVHAGRGFGRQRRRRPRGPHAAGYNHRPRHCDDHLRHRREEPPARRGHPARSGGVARGAGRHGPRSCRA